MMGLRLLCSWPVVVGLIFLPILALTFSLAAPPEKSFQYKVVDDSEFTVTPKHLDLSGFLECDVKNIMRFEVADSVEKVDMTCEVNIPCTLAALTFSPQPMKGRAAKGLCGKQGKVKLAWDHHFEMAFTTGRCGLGFPSKQLVPFIANDFSCHVRAMPFPRPVFANAPRTVCEFKLTLDKIGYLLSVLYKKVSLFDDCNEKDATVGSWKRINLSRKSKKLMRKAKQKGVKHLLSEVYALYDIEKNLEALHERLTKNLKLKGSKAKVALESSKDDLYTDLFTMDFFTFEDPFTSLSSIAPGNFSANNSLLSASAPLSASLPKPSLLNITASKNSLFDNLLPSKYILKSNAYKAPLSKTLLLAKAPLSKNLLLAKAPLSKNLFPAKDSIESNLLPAKDSLKNILILSKDSLESAINASLSKNLLPRKKLIASAINTSLSKKLPPSKYFRKGASFNDISKVVLPAKDSLKNTFLNASLSKILLPVKNPSHSKSLPARHSLKSSVKNASLFKKLSPAKDSHTSRKNPSAPITVSKFKFPAKKDSSSRSTNRKNKHITRKFEHRTRKFKRTRNKDKTITSIFKRTSSKDKRITKKIKLTASKDKLKPRIFGRTASKGRPTTSIFERTTTKGKHFFTKKFERAPSKRKSTTSIFGRTATGGKH